MTDVTDASAIIFGSMLDTLQLVLIAHALYYFLISNFADQAALLRSVWYVWYNISYGYSRRLILEYRSLDVCLKCSAGGVALIIYGFIHKS